VLAGDGLAAVAQLRVSPGRPVRAMLAQRLSDAGEILAKLGGECSAEYKYDGVRVQAHRIADGSIELYTRRLERVSSQFPDVVELLAAGLRPREVIVEGEVVAFDPAAGELRPFQEVMFRRRKYGIAEAVRDVPVGLFCFELLYADGEDLTRLPYPQRRARLAAALTLAPQLRLSTATRVTAPEALDAAFEQAVTDGCEGLVCKSVRPESGYQAGARGGQWIKLKRDYRTELADTVDLAVVGAFAGRGRQLRRAAAGRVRRGGRRVPHRVQVRHRVLRRRPGRTPRPAGPAGHPGPARPGGRPPGARRVVRARAGAGGPQRRADPLPQLPGRLGPAQAGRRAGHAVPPVHRPVAGRQGRHRRDHDG
jgi:ATP-dependent DNA ligase